MFGIGNEVRNDVGRSIVNPVKHYARYDATCAPVHPAEQQADERGMDTLWYVAVNGAED